MNFHGIFWLIVIVLVAGTICFIIHTLSNIPNKDVEMAKAGYIEKVIVIGDPNNLYSRQIIKVWVKFDGTPIVEQR